MKQRLALDAHIHHLPFKAPFRISGYVFNGMDVVVATLSDGEYRVRGEGDDVPGLVGRFDVVNIKLDKCGGLTEGLMIARAARDAGLDVMVGNMCGSSLSMAPAFVLGQLCDICDLDGPIFLSQDHEPPVTYRDGNIWCDQRVWGAEARTSA